MRNRDLLNNFTSLTHTQALGFEGNTLAIQGNFRTQTTVWLSVAAVVVIGPFAINHLIAERWVLGLFSLIVSSVLMANGLLMFLQGSSPRLVRLLVVPLSTVALMVAIDRQGIIGVLWTFPTILLYFATLEEIEAWCSNCLLLTATTWAMNSAIDPSLLVRSIATLLLVFVFAGIFVRAISRQHKILSTELVTDHLTRLRNRRALASTLSEAHSSARKNTLAVTLLYVDLDHFKRINDTYGHSVGDDVLCATANILCVNSLPADTAMRIGGEEFVVVLSSTNADMAIRRAEHIQQDMRNDPLLQRLWQTASIGVAELTAQDASWEHWLARADRALYQAKAAGRDTIILADNTPPKAAAQPAT